MSPKFKHVVFCLENWAQEGKIPPVLDGLTLTHRGIYSCTGKSFSEALILASTNPQYNKILFSTIASSGHFVYINCSECKNKSKKQFVYTTCSDSVLSLEFSCTKLVIYWTIFCYIVG